MHRRNNRVKPLCRKSPKTPCRSPCEARSGLVEWNPPGRVPERLRTPHAALQRVVFSDRERETARMGYQYGDHTSRTKVSPRSIM